MKRLNKETLSFSTKVATRIFAALGMMLFLAACPGKGGGDGVVTVPPIIGVAGCGNCGSISNPVLLTTFKAEGAGGAIALTNMQLFGQNNMSGNYNNGSSGYYNYSGPVAAQGVLEVRQNTQDPYSQCMIPAGSYALQTYQVGQIGYQGWDLYIPAMISTTGGIELKIWAPTSQEGMGFLQGGSRLYTYVIVTRVNGYQCSQDFYNIFN